MRLAETRDTWGRLLPQPPDPDVAVDVLHAASGGALKSRAFWAVREMRRYGLWDDEALDRFACVPDGRVRKRAVRMGLVDLPEKADTFADMKAVSRALHAVLRLGRVAGRLLRPARQHGRPALRGLRRRAHGRLPHAALPLAAGARGGLSGCRMRGAAGAEAPARRRRTYSPPPLPSTGQTPIGARAPAEGRVVARTALSGLRGRTEGVLMFWEILAWAAVALLYVFRLALVVGVIAVVVLIVRMLRAPKQPVRHAGAPARK